MDLLGLEVVCNIESPHYNNSLKIKQDMRIQNEYIYFMFKVMNEKMTNTKKINM